MDIEREREREREFFIYRETNKHNYVCFFHIQTLPKHGTTLDLITQRETDRQTHRQTHIQGRQSKERQRLYHICATTRYMTVTGTDHLDRSVQQPTDYIMYHYTGIA